MIAAYTGYTRIANVNLSTAPIFIKLAKLVSDHANLSSVNGSILIFLIVGNAAERSIQRLEINASNADPEANQMIKLTEAANMHHRSKAVQPPTPYFTDKIATPKGPSTSPNGTHIVYVAPEKK